MKNTSDLIRAGGEMVWTTETVHMPMHMKFSWAKNKRSNYNDNLEGYTDTAEENWHSWISLGVNLTRREVVLRIDLAHCTKEGVQ